MQKRIIIIHGWEGNPDEVMLQYMKNELEKENFEVFIPAMPDTEEPEISAWVNKISEVVGVWDPDTYFIGHSIGCQGILRYLQTLPKNAKVGGAVFIAPWMELDAATLEEEGPEVEEVARPWMQTPIDFEKIMPMAKEFVCILSDNDPYVPVDSNKKIFKHKLDAKIIVEHDKGHFIPDAGVVDNPTAVKEILRLSS